MDDVLHFGDFSKTGACVRACVRAFVRAYNRATTGEQQFTVPNWHNMSSHTMVTCQSFVVVAVSSAALCAATTTNYHHRRGTTSSHHMMCQTNIDMTMHVRRLRVPFVACVWVFLPGRTPCNRRGRGGYFPQVNPGVEVQSGRVLGVSALSSAVLSRMIRTCVAHSARFTALWLPSLSSPSFTL